jgi:hypothetical protein
MRFTALAAMAALCPPVVLASAAGAQTLELGQPTGSPLVEASCPSSDTPAQCKIVLTRSTALETLRAGIVNPMKVTKPGVVVAFTVGLSGLSSNQKTLKSEIHSLDISYGGTTQAALAVLKPAGAPRLNKWQVVAESPIFHLQPYLGTVTQFPLANSLGAAGTPPTAAPLPVAKGDEVALTVPTWAPVLTIGLASSNRYAYRQSRRENCANTPATEQAQSTVGAQTIYRCDYVGTEIQYAATEITSPAPPRATTKKR